MSCWMLFLFLVLSMGMLCVDFFMVYSMWSEISFLVVLKFVVVFMVDVVVSGGYYMVMVVGMIVVEDLILIGFIGVVMGKLMNICNEESMCWNV